MKIQITYYVEITSSWCYWAEPAWEELKHRYAHKPVEFQWKIALLDEAAYPRSRSQCEWFYRRSGTIMRSLFMLNSGWFEPGLKEWLAPNLAAEGARELGVGDDRVRLALAHAALREGQKIGQWDVAIPIAARAAGLDPKTLEAKARAPEAEARVRASTLEFHSLKVTQRPTFVIESNISDRAVFSGLVKLAPLSAAVDAMLEDAAAYAAHAAHFGSPPAS